MTPFLLSLFLILSPPSDFYWYQAVLDDCYDADTCTLAELDLGLNIIRKDVVTRLYGINAPELRGPEKPEGEAARDWLLKRVHPGDAILIHTHRDESGKYGRLLATLFYQCDRGWCNANQEMLDEGIARPY